MKLSAKNELEKQFGEHMQKTAEVFGTAMGALSFYIKHFEKAMDELKVHGCEHCNKRKCSRCHDRDCWTWDGITND